MVVLLTDGRANVSLAKSNRDPDALAEDAPKPSTVGAGLGDVHFCPEACVSFASSAFPCGTSIW